MSIKYLLKNKEAGTQAEYGSEEEAKYQRQLLLDMGLEESMLELKKKTHSHNHTDFRSGTVKDRREDVQSDFTPYYKNYWDIENIVNIESEREELTETNDRSVAQILECADIDTIIDTYDKQIAIQEKVIRSKSGESLALKAENKHSEATPEAERVKESLFDSEILRPNIYAVMKLDDGTVEWVRFVNTEKLLQAWVLEDLEPRVWTGGKRANEKLFFDMEEVDNHDATVYKYE